MRLERQLIPVRRAMAKLEESSGLDDPIDSLAHFMAAVDAFLLKTMLIIAGAYADPELRTCFSEKWRALGFGPRAFVAQLGSWLSRERRSVGWRYAANLARRPETLLAGSFFSSFQRGLLPNAAVATLPHELKTMVRGTASSSIGGPKP